MNSDLKSLIDPLGEIEFLTRLRERRLAFVPGRDPRRFETLLDWETLNYLLDSATFPLDVLRVMRESVAIPTNFYLRDGRVDAVALSKLLDQGVSLIFNRLDKHVPALRALCKNLERDTLEQIGAAAVLTSGRGGALRCHCDPEDLIILQVAGTKRWQVFGSPAGDTVPGMEASSPEGPVVFDQVLQPGDLLFLPARVWHHCENGPQHSLHVSILFMPPSGRDLIPTLVSQLSLDEIFNRPLTRHGSATVLAEHETALKARLIETIRAMSLDRFLAERAASGRLESVQLQQRADQAYKK